MIRRIESIEAEIQQEKAEALGRAGERLERKLTELAELRNVLLRVSDAASTSPATTERDSLADLHEKVNKYTRLLEEARQARHYLTIQREAVGLRRHEDIDRQYPVPPPLRLWMIIRDSDKESP
jgi:predicted phage gp36 major capsid-like protein